MYHVRGMKNAPFALPVIMAELAIASWETIFHRTVMMVQGTCSADEYERMVTEKADAMHHSALALVNAGSDEEVMAPFLTRAQANARRLRERF